MDLTGQLSDVAVCMLVLNDVQHDSRVLKEAACLSAAGAQVQIIGMESPGGQTSPGLPDGVRLVAPQRRSRVGPASLRGLADLSHELTFQRALASQAAATRADVYHCHDLLTVWAGLRAAGGRARVVYDSHELFTERVGITPWRALLLGCYERYALHQVDLVIAASEPRARIMHWEYGAPRLPVSIVNAVPLSEAVEVPHPKALRARREIDASHVIIYQGGLHPGRGLEAVIDGLALLPDGYTLVLMGTGQLQGELAERIRARGLTGRVHLWPAVPTDEVAAWAAAADAGVVTYLPTCRNNIYCAPNKVSEYAAAGLPVLGADLVGLREYTDRYEMAELFEPGDAASFAAAARRLLADPARVRRARAESRRLLQEVHWEDQAARLVAAYREMLDRD
jgi:glycosyltransferase involved in cell wall biosynthesis